MKTTIYGADLNDMLLESNYPDFFYDETSEIAERSFSAELFLGKGQYREIYFEGIHIGFGDIQLKQDTVLHFESDFETVEMHFVLCGNTNTYGGSFEKEIEFGCNQHNIFYADGFTGKSEWSASLRLKVFEINLQPKFFRRYFPENILKFNPFAKAIEKGKSSQLNSHHLRVTPQMLLIIDEIINCNRVGKFKRMLIEAKVIELLLLQLEQMSDHECEDFCSLKKNDLEKMFAAKEFILNNLFNLRSLIGLAQEVGTNEFTLKKGFKEVFGTTVFGFWSEVKMQQAKSLLLEQALTVNEVSELVGYKNPQHFSTAFKKHFGISPSQLKS